MKNNNIALAVFLRDIPAHVSKKRNLEECLKENKNSFDCLTYNLYGGEYVAIELPYTGNAYNRSILAEKRRWYYIFRDFVVAKKNGEGKYVDVTRDDLVVLKKLIDR